MTFLPGIYFIGSTLIACNQQSSPKNISSELQQLNDGKPYSIERVMEPSDCPRGLIRLEYSPNNGAGIANICEFNFFSEGRSRIDRDLDGTIDLRINLRNSMIFGRNNHSTNYSNLTGTECHEGPGYNASECSRFTNFRIDQSYFEEQAQWFLNNSEDLQPL